VIIEAIPPVAANVKFPALSRENRVAGEANKSFRVLILNADVSADISQFFWSAAASVSLNLIPGFMPEYVFNPVQVLGADNEGPLPPGITAGGRVPSVIIAAFNGNGLNDAPLSVEYSNI
jgi:hypothetical protein